MKLIDLLPYMALAAFVEPAAAQAHSGRNARRHAMRARGPAADQPMARALGGAQAKPVIMRRADGTQCRVRETTTTITTTVAAATTTSVTTQAAATEAAWTQTDSTQAATESAQATDSSSTEATTESTDSSTLGFVAENNWAQATSTTTASTSVSTGTTSTSSGSKYGWCYPMGEYAITLAPEGITTNTAWFYTYSSSSDVWTAMNNRGWNLEFVPMLWGYNRLAGGVNEYSPSTWASSQGSWPSSTQHALFINEPDVEGQANLSPTDALTLWYNYFAPATTSLKRGHAAVASNYYGIPWLQEFNAACSGDCTYDFHAWHWYGSDFATFQSDLEEFHAAFPDKNIWITEFACNSYTGAGSCSDSQTLAFHAAVQPYLESLDYVERYSPYGALPTGYGDESSSAPINTNNDIMTITSYGGDGFMSLSNLGKFYTGQGSI